MDKKRKKRKETYSKHKKQKNRLKKQKYFSSYFPQFLTFSPTIGPTAMREGAQTARETLQNGQDHQGQAEQPRLQPLPYDDRRRLRQD
jgi:hypothetical protein